MSHLMKDGGSRCSPTPTKYIHIQSTTVYVPSSELGLSHPFSRQRVRSGGSPNWFDDWRKSLAICLLCTYPPHIL
jgi:hypothetical protein